MRSRGMYPGAIRAERPSPEGLINAAIGEKAKAKALPAWNAATECSLLMVVFTEGHKDGATVMRAKVKARPAWNIGTEGSLRMVVFY